MANPYSSLAYGQYTNAEIMDEMETAGSYRRRAGASACGINTVQAAYANYNTAEVVQNAQRTQMQPAAAQTALAQTAAAAGERRDFFDVVDRNHDGVISYAEYEQAMGNQACGAGVRAWGQEAAGVRAWGQEVLFEGAVEVYQRGDRRVVSEGMVDHRQQVVSSVRPIYTFEKTVEVPQVIVRETEREVPKPQLIERIIEVPKTEVRERSVIGPPTVEYKEQIVEVPVVHVENRVVHVPRREIQERLIEIPRIEYVERIEYDDYVEYREVPVDKIVEVPEIEYHIREVEHLVPQTYVQEYFVDKYTEMPATQVQEVYREEQAGMQVSTNTVQSAQEFMQSTAAAMAEARAYEAAKAQIYSSQAAQAFAEERFKEGYAQGLAQAQASSMAYHTSQAAGSMNPYSSMNGCGATNPYTSDMEAAIALAPVGSIYAVPKGTIRHAAFQLPPGSIPPGTLLNPGAMEAPGSMPPVQPMGSMQLGPEQLGYMPSGSMQQVASPPTPPVPYGYNPYASRSSVPAY